MPLTEDEKQEMKFLASAINGHEPQGFYAIRERLIRKFGYNRFRDLYVGAAILTRSSKLTPDTPEVVQAVDESARRPGGWQEDTYTVDPKKVARRNGLTPAQQEIVGSRPEPLLFRAGKTIQRFDDRKSHQAIAASAGSIIHETGVLEAQADDMEFTMRGDKAFVKPLRDIAKRIERLAKSILKEAR